MLNYWFNEFICLFYLNLIDHWFNYKKVSAQAFKSHEVVKIETKHYSIKLLASQVHLKHRKLSEKLVISQVNLLSILHPLLFNDFSGYIVCQLATDFIEFEKIVGAKRFWREVFIVVIELRKVLIEVMFMHVATLCPILLMWLFIRGRIELSPKSYKEVLDEARLADLGVPKN